MKQTLWLAFLALALTTPAWAEMKVAVFDATQVMTSTNAAKRAQTAIEAKVTEAQQRIAALQKPLLEKQKTLKEQAAVMAPDKAREAQATFTKELTAFRTQTEAIQNGLDRDNMQMRKRITDTVRVVVEKIAAEKKYDLVLPKGFAYYSSPMVPDISAEVLAQTNAILDK
jgi:outer membrane protein